MIHCIQLYRKLIISLLFICCGYYNLQAYNDFVPNDVSSMDFDQNLRYPEIKSKQRKAIVEYQQKIGKSLKNKGFQVESIRNGEVLVVTIQANKIFEANKIELNKNANIYLTPIFSLLNKTGYHRLLVAMHSDDTGNSLYSENLTNDRALSICDWAEMNGYPTSSIVAYPMGKEFPMCPNNSIMNRKKNRRVEIYIIPEKIMIQAAQNNKLK